MGIDAKRQKAHFDEEQNRYNQALILRPPLHTRLETTEIIRRVAHLGTARIADFGAGSGRLTIPLAEAGFAVTSIDLSEASLAEIVALGNRLGLALTTASRLPDGASFDAIVGSDVLHHVELDHILPLLRSALGERGKIVFSEPNALHPAWYIYLPLVSSWSVEKGVMHCSLWRLSRELRDAGFTDIRITGLGLLPRPVLNFSKRLCALNDRLGDLPILKLFAYRYIIEAG